MDLDAERIARALRAAHRCPPGCRRCRREDKLVRTGGLERFRHVVTGTLALRLAHAKAEFGIPIPRFSDDPLEQWLVEEAIMAAGAEAGRREAQVTNARAAARQQAKDLLAQYREQRGG